MGGNGSYRRVAGGVPIAYRTHTDTGYRISGHKVLVLTSNNRQVKVPMNSNSDHPTYLVAKTDKNGVLTIKQIAIYKNHKIVKVIDLEFDDKGRSKGFDNGKGTHMHKWSEDSNGNVGRKRHDKSNSFPVDAEYAPLINDIEKFNQKKHVV